MAVRSHSSNLSIIEAVETLSSIADLDFDRDIGITQKHEMVLDNETVAYKTIHWLQQEDANATVNLVRETFRVILHYLRQFYKKEYGYVSDPKTIEGIKTIMVLVGEAAKKLDKYTSIFQQTHQSVMDFKEYKQLQDFYFSKIARKIDEGMLGKWILGLSIGKSIHKRKAKDQTKNEKLDSYTDSKQIQHVFVDLETVKKDTEYELFFIRKEDGTRFFNPRLLRNIQLVCDFGNYFGQHKGTDPLENLPQWQDRVLHICARNILKVLGPRVEHFYHDTRKVREHELVSCLNKAILALMLSSHSQNLLRHKPIKSCGEYFEDFQVFLREALKTRVYQKWTVYPPSEANSLAFDLLDLTHTICRALYTNLVGLEELFPAIQSLLKEASLLNSNANSQQKEGQPQSISRQLSRDYAAMNKLMKRHANGPLLKVLNILENQSFHVYDPILQHNIPSQLFDMYLDDKRISHIRCASPICQEFIQKSCINEEFKGFIFDYAIQVKKHLLFSLEDRTSWRGHARCNSIEELQHRAEFKEALCVVTLAIDTEFFHQLAPYHHVNHASAFIDQFKEHLKGEASGFYFPSSLNREELFTFIDKALPIVHHLFFSDKNVLLREHRLDFIQIVYLLLQLKILDIVKPDSFSLTCKDGIDIGDSYSAGLFALLKWMNPQGMTEGDLQYLQFILYAPSLLIRERVPLPERFNRLVSALRTIENARQEVGAEHFPALIQEAFVGMFNTPVLSANIALPH